MSAILPLFLLAALVVLVAAMPWHRPHPNHLFFVRLLRAHLQSESELSCDSSESKVTPRISSRVLRSA